MQTVIVDSWAKVPFIGVQVWKFDNPENAFKYAESEYLLYGYNLAYFSTDVNVLYLSKQA